MSLNDSSQVQPTSINGHDYYLQKGNDKIVDSRMQSEHKYAVLDNKATESFSRQDECIASPLQEDHLHVMRNHLHQDLCKSLIKEFNQDPHGIQDFNVLAVILPQIFTPELDQQLISYFGSEYCISWWSIYKIGSKVEETDYSCHWHCDAGPKKHLKVITYLNSQDEHGSDTNYLNKDSTDKLKEIGYIFNDINNRVTDISDICQYFDIDFSPKYTSPKTGDTLIFNPYQLAHKACPTDNGQVRYALDFCVVQSPIHWKKAAEQHCQPLFGGRKFERFAQTILNFSTQEKDSSYIDIPLKNEINSLAHAKFIINSIFSDKSVVDALYQHICKNDPYLKDCQSILYLMYLCKGVLQAQLNPNPKTVINKVIVNALLDLANYQEIFKDSYERYSPTGKPNANAIFWPNPVHPKHPQSQYQQLPYVKKNPIMDIDTPIGSAGSCFAFEIAKYFQQEGYNYVVTERNDDPNSGVLIDGYTPGDPIAKFCANYGILFNTPSFSQLAERAFGTRDFEKILVNDSSGYYLDPYRENVYFESPESYLNDYEKHLNAVKESFLRCKVFVVTLGLNECWQLHDGTVMSRNPRENMFQLVKHRTLTVEENVSHIQSFFDLVRQFNPEFKLIISVSPIPFLATGRADEHHIITANNHSKAVLLVAAEQLVANNEDMYYLPSYELVTQCVENAWSDDRRHVKSEVVAKVVNMFKEIFVK